MCRLVGYSLLLCILCRISAHFMMSPSGNFRLFFIDFFSIFFKMRYMRDPIYSKLVYSNVMTMIRLDQGPYRQVCVQFKDFQGLHKDSQTVFKNYNFMKNTNLHYIVLLLKI